MRRNAGFTLVEMVIAVTIFAAGSLYIYATFTGVTRSSRTATLEIDLGSQNKRALTKIFNELQATSLTAQDTDGLDSTEPEAVCVIEDDTAAPAPLSIARLVNRVDTTYVQTTSDGEKLLGDGTEQARERVVTQNRRVRYRKVIGYQFNAGAGTIMPEWSNWVTLRVNNQRQLVREVPGRQPRVISNRVDAFHAEARPDGTIRVTLVSARRDPVTSNWRRYANAVIIHPKN
jgi:prepilin-type N-terminal cleavage/methylation domain-containing protein